VTIRGRVLLASPDGMLGRAWMALLERRNIDHDAVSFPAFDLTDEASVRLAVSPRYQWVVNCAAWTDVDGAEAKESQAAAVNGTGVGWLADACRSAGATLIHYSTDYVFPGAAMSPYRTDCPPDPVNAYGRTKALGEGFVVSSGARHLLLRTSWLYAPWGKNFVRTIAGLSHERSELKVVDDQRGRPTSAEHLAQISLHLMDRQAHATGAAGIFHVTDGGECTWFDLACAVVASTNPSCRVRRCSSADFPRPARRPTYSVLDIAKTEQVVGPMPSWQENIASVLRVLEP